MRIRNRTTHTIPFCSGGCARSKNFPRALAVITYIASKNIPDLTPYKLLKIIFLADRQHLLQYGEVLSLIRDGRATTGAYEHRANCEQFEKPAR